MTPTKTKTVDDGLVLFSLDSFQSEQKDVTRLETSMTWSYSRRGSFISCPRRYYYEYYGSITKLALDEPNKARLQFAQRLTNRHLLAGQVLHSAIDHYFKTAQKGYTLREDELMAWASREFGSWSKWRC